jgi:transcriptional regulator with XRE-family HTH domain
MKFDCSFKKLVEDKCYDGLYQAAEEFVHDNWESMDLYTNNVHQIGSVELDDIYIKQIDIDDLPGPRLKFSIGLQLEICVHEGDYHYDDEDDCYPWIRVECEGDLLSGLKDWAILNVGEYYKNYHAAKPLSDSLVPVISKDMLEKTATDILKGIYPEALHMPNYGEKPERVDPQILAKRLGLKVESRPIRKDESVFGQIYFADATVPLYDAETDADVETLVSARTVLIDPSNFLLRNIESANNTIVHECVHWIKHWKAFELAKLFDKDTSCISCATVGTAKPSAQGRAEDFMEWQANALAPRILMPKNPFIAKAEEYLAVYTSAHQDLPDIAVMEQVIQDLADDFGVSKQSAKIRLVELGYEDAIGTYTYLDGHYVRPHAFRKGALKLNQTFSISAQDAAFLRYTNPELRTLTENGDYVFVENHYVYNTPLYVERDDFGSLRLTDYALTHMDECCIIFDLSISRSNNISEIYHTECFLNRDNSSVTFEVKLAEKYRNLPPEGQAAIRQKELKEWMDIRSKMTDDPKQCMEVLLKWCGTTYVELAGIIGVSEKTIRRAASGETENPDMHMVVKICFALNLPPTLSEKLMTAFNCRLNPNRLEDQWIREALNIKYPEPYENIEEYLSQFGVTL